MAWTRLREMAHAYSALFCILYCFYKTVVYDYVKNYVKTLASAIFKPCSLYSNNTCTANMLDMDYETTQDLICAVQILNKELHGTRCIGITGNEKSIAVAVSFSYKTAKAHLGQEVTPEQIQKICSGDVWHYIIERGPVCLEWFGDSLPTNVACEHVLTAKDILEKVVKSSLLTLADAERFVRCIDSIRELYDNRGGDCLDSQSW